MFKQSSCDIITNSICKKHCNVFWTILNSNVIIVKFLFITLFGFYYQEFCIQTDKMFNKIFTPREEVEDFFRTMDRDFDQKLTFAEFMGEESHIEKLFKSMDKNNDGYVTKKVNQ